MSSKIKIIRPKCDPSLAQDKSLPCTAYLVEYMEQTEGRVNPKVWDDPQNKKQKK